MQGVWVVWVGQSVGLLVCFSEANLGWAGLGFCRRDKPPGSRLIPCLQTSSLVNATQNSADGLGVVPLEVL